MLIRLSYPRAIYEVGTLQCHLNKAFCITEVLPALAPDFLPTLSSPSFVSIKLVPINPLELTARIKPIQKSLFISSSVSEKPVVETLAPELSDVLMGGVIVIISVAMVTIKLVFKVLT